VSYAFVVDGTVQTVAGQPSNLTRLDDGGRVLFSPYIDTATLNACGWYVVVEPARPSITASQTFDPDTFVFAANAVTRTYHVRNKTQAELDADAAAAQAALERQQAKDAIADLDTYLALASPTNAQTLVVVKLLCRIAKRLIRDAFGG
jgi:hypothetical protein